MTVTNLAWQETIAPNNLPLRYRDNHLFYYALIATAVVYLIIITPLVSDATTFGIACIPFILLLTLFYFANADSQPLLLNFNFNLIEDHFELIVNSRSFRIPYTNIYRLRWDSDDILLMYVRDGRYQTNYIDWFNIDRPVRIPANAFKNSIEAQAFFNELSKRWHRNLEHKKY